VQYTKFLLNIITSIVFLLNISYFIITLLICFIVNLFSPPRLPSQNGKTPRVWWHGYFS